MRYPIRIIAISIIIFICLTLFIPRVHHDERIASTINKLKPSSWSFGSSQAFQKTDKTQESSLKNSNVNEHNNALKNEEKQKEPTYVDYEDPESQISQKEQAAAIEMLEDKYGDKHSGKGTRTWVRDSTTFVTSTTAVVAKPASETIATTTSAQFFSNTTVPVATKPKLEMLKDTVKAKVGLEETTKNNNKAIDSKTPTKNAKINGYRKG